MRRPWMWVGIGGGVLGLGLVLCLMLCVLGGNQGGCSRYFGGAIAVLEVNGQIATADEFLKDVERVRKADHLRGVVLRVNSPGGSVGASQEMYHALQRLAAAKPLVASFGTVAASGGYYIGLAARQIFVLPGTVTASIGVRMSHLDAEELIHRLGLKPDILKSGYFKDVGAMHRPMRDEERELLLHVLRTMHQQFKDAVIASRHLPAEKVDAIADGRVLTGSDAIAAGLVDHVGDLQDAINAAAALAGLKPDPTVVRIGDDIPWWVGFVKGMVGSMVGKPLHALVDELRGPVFGYEATINHLEGGSGE